MEQYDSEDILAGGNRLTLWHFANPSEAADAAIALYGSGASLAAASAAFAARYAGREDDFRFWFTVFSRLRRSDGKEPPAGKTLSDEQKPPG
ncbi:hypothetical protein EJ074_00685 [Mesorhizobium sp. M3A.F.Ca.ET.080.04.2.1]|uniref:hypothetical protein n=1 Tax=Mesorhizobium sp. M3A.F.Ca.ET.080.04.2.1 TaxID=2493676 RepID=UPI000F7641DE|nr:hypothetical protein [Mesorhizobium sp. M3A.F.Ca.ET.080.04.2.1]AZO07803.1 hypothetical protein EJ074_00685 [Mesorhizobium sp. M3A.F.Ca.ET.080.04.2.1]RWF17264.1 MAG: hypothetical protein EOS64_23495 [Mesorhizobium sp.]